TAEAIDQLLGKRLYVLARVLREQQHLHQLVIRQALGSRIEQPLPQPVAVAVVMRRRTGRGIGEPGASPAARRPPQPRSLRRARISANRAPAIRRGSSVA